MVDFPKMEKNFLLKWKYIKSNKPKTKERSKNRNLPWICKQASDLLRFLDKQDKVPRKQINKKLNVLHKEVKMEIT